MTRPPTGQTVVKTLTFRSALMKSPVSEGSIVPSWSSSSCWWRALMASNPGLSSTRSSNSRNSASWLVSVNSYINERFRQMSRFDKTYFSNWWPYVSLLFGCFRQKTTETQSKPRHFDTCKGDSQQQIITQVKKGLFFQIQ